MKELINEIKRYNDLQVITTKEERFSIIYVPTNKYIGFYSNGVYNPIVNLQEDFEYNIVLSSLFKKYNIPVEF